MNQSFNNSVNLLSMESINQYECLNKQFNNNSKKNSSNSLSNFVFDNWIEYYLILFGYIIGYGSFWRFPYLIYTNGGGIFVFVFIILTVLIGIPCFYIESFFGQMFRKGPVEVFSNINKRLTGFGWAMVIVPWMISLYYSTLLTWSYYFLFASFKSPLPWSNKGKFDDHGHELPSINSNYFSKEVLNLTNNISELGSISFSRLICLFIAYTSVYICIAKGILTSSKVVYITAPTPVIMIVLLLFKGITLDGAWEGVYYLFVPDFSKIFDSTIWIKAANQVTFAIGLGQGATILVSKYRKKSDNLTNSAIAIPCLTVVFGLICSFVNFCFLGNLSKQINVPVNKLPIEGSNLAFVTYPSALAMLPFSNIWAIVFFIMLVTLGIDSQFTYNEQTSFYLYEYILKPKGIDKVYSSIIVCSVGFLIGLLFIFDGGYYMLILFDNNVTLISCFVIALGECYTAVYYIGEEKLNKICIENTGSNIPKFVIFSAKYINPIVFGLFAISSIIKALFFKENDFESYLFPKMLKIIIIGLPLFVIVYFYILYKKQEAKLNNEDVIRLESFKNSSNVNSTNIIYFDK